MAATCAEDVALATATRAATTRPTSRPLPAARAAGPNAANTPAPIIEPSPIITADPVPSLRASWFVTAATLAGFAGSPHGDVGHGCDGAGLTRRRARRPPRSPRARRGRARG